MLISAVLVEIDLHRGRGLEANRGFSLVELVSVMVLISILAVFIAPKMAGTGGYDEYIIRDQLISAIRAAQQNAMYDQAPGRCYRVNITTNSYTIERSTDSGATFASTPVSTRDFGFDEGDASIAAALDKVSLPTVTQRFDGFGNPVTTCGGANSGNRTINIVGSSTLSLCIYSTGYVRAGACI